MEHVAYDQPLKYPAVEPPAGASGELRNVAANKCVDTRFRGADERFQLEPCVKDDPKKNMGEQNLEMTWHKDIRPSKRNICFDVSRSNERAPVVLFACHQMQGNQLWKYRLDTSQLYHPISDKCLDADTERGELFMSGCDPGSKSQMWKWEKMDQDLIRRWGQNIR